MKYSVVLEDRAIADLEAVPDDLRKRVFEGVLAIGDEPTGPLGESQNPSQRGRVHEFSFAHDDMNCWMRVLFQFGKEQTLYVSEIRWEIL